MTKWFPSVAVHTSFTDFMGLLQVCVFDDAGIDYTMPHHAYAEESGKW